MKNNCFNIEDYLHRVKSFHGHVAPGVVIGGFMVHLARTKMPEGVLFDAISETPACVPDAVQMLTPCTIGNGWLKIINLGRFAVSLYDKHHGNGFRVFLDTGKLENWPEIRPGSSSSSPEKNKATKKFSPRSGKPEWKYAGRMPHSDQA